MDFENVPIALQSGLITEASPYDAKGRFVSGNNIRFYQNRAQKIGGYVTGPGGIGSLGNPARGVCAWADLAGNQYMAWGTANKLWLMKGGVIFDITPSGMSSGNVIGQTTYAWGQGSWGQSPWGGYSAFFTSTTQPRVWTLSNWGQNLVACYWGGPLYQWEPGSGTGTPASIVTQAPTSILTFWVSEVDRYLVALGAVDGSNTILADGGSQMTMAWSSQQDLTTWVAAINNTAGDLRLETGSTIVASADTQLGRLILTDAAAYLATYVGPPYIFDVVQVGEGHDPPVGPNAIVSHKGTAFWVGPHHIYTFNGLVTQVPCPIENNIYDNLDYAQTFQVYAATNRQFDEVTVFYPDLRDGTHQNSRAFSWNDSGWAQNTFARSSWLDQNITTNYPVGMDSSGTINFHESGVDAAGQPLSYSLETGEIELGTGDYFTNIRRLIPNWQRCAGTHNVQIESRRYPQEAPALYSRSFSGTQGKISVRARGRSHRLMFSGNTLGCDFRMGAWRANYRQDGTQG